ncbi:nitroreductase family protein [Eupransor demetentiae]|uniref:Nitroreductase (NfnB) n=1 Tax=Eupransor demetentiae TaxID=3109584 RepID=A0ABM9N5U3_9LACO|nr:Nitroreductase (NfnB) [Lactobacillaceae bacterium LMG 33000]
MHNETLDLLHQHQSIRAFTDKPVSDEQVREMILAATAGPNMQNYQPVTFIEIKDQALKTKITEQVGMKYIQTATRFFVLTVDFNKDLIGLNAEQKAIVEDRIQHYQLLEGGIVSASIALGRAQIAAESMGLGTVTMAGAMGAFELYEKELNLPRYVKAIMGFSVGYPDQNPGVKPKLPLSGSLMEGAYHQDQMEAAVAEYNETMKDYFKERGMDTDWTQHTAKLFAQMKPNVKLSEYPQAKGFNLK